MGTVATQFFDRQIYDTPTLAELPPGVYDDILYCPMYKSAY